MITRAIPIALLLLSPIGLLAGQGGQAAARTQVVQPTRPTVTLPISSVVPAGADSANAINKDVSAHPKEKVSTSLRFEKQSRAATQARSTNDSAVVAPPRTVKPRVKPVQVSRPPNH